MTIVITLFRDAFSALHYTTSTYVYTCGRACRQIAPKDSCSLNITISYWKYGIRCITVVAVVTVTQRVCSFQIFFFQSGATCFSFRFIHYGFFFFTFVFIYLFFLIASAALLSQWFLTSYGWWSCLLVVECRRMLNVVAVATPNWPRLRSCALSCT